MYPRYFTECCSNSKLIYEIFVRKISYYPFVRAILVLLFLASAYLAHFFLSAKFSLCYLQLRTSTTRGRLIGITTFRTKPAFILLLSRRRTFPFARMVQSCIVSEHEITLSHWTELYLEEKECFDNGLLVFICGTLSQEKKARTKLRLLRD